MKNFANGKITSQRQRKENFANPDVYILLHRKDKYYTYRPTFLASAPFEKFLRTLRLVYVAHKMLNYMQDESYPLPVKMTPTGFDQEPKPE
jgi:hypothetical protein